MYVAKRMTYSTHYSLLLIAIDLLLLFLMRLSSTKTTTGTSSSLLAGVAKTAHHRPLHKSFWLLNIDLKWSSNGSSVLKMALSILTCAGTWDRWVDDPEAPGLRQTFRESFNCIHPRCLIDPSPEAICRCATVRHCAPVMMWRSFSEQMLRRVLTELRPVVPIRRLGCLRCTV